MRTTRDDFTLDGVRFDPEDARAAQAGEHLGRRECNSGRTCARPQGSSETIGHAFYHLRSPDWCLADPKVLAETAAKLNRWEFMQVIAPLPASRGTGGPINATPFSRRSQP